jgi:hypothetical protein
MFIVCPMNIRATWGRRDWSGLPHGNYVHRGTDEHKANVASGWLRDYVAYARWPGGTDERKLGSSALMNMWPYFRPVTFTR